MGTDKALLTRNQQDMLSFSQQLLKGAGINDVVISGKKHGISDTFENLGPMGGIYTVIKRYQPNAILVLPVDLPLMDSESLKQLKFIGELSQKISYFQDNFLPCYIPINAFVEQFFQSTFTTSMLSNNALNLNKKGPSIRALINQVPSKSILPTNKKCLFNANTPEQWLHAKQQFTLNRNSHV